MKRQTVSNLFKSKKRLLSSAVVSALMLLASGSVILAGLLVLSAPSRAAEPDPSESYPTLVYQLQGLQKNLGGISSQYVITNVGVFAATTVHEFYDSGSVLVAVLCDTVAPGGAKSYKLATISVLPDGYSGHVVISADQPITVTVDDVSVVSPVADAEGPYAVDEGDTVTLDASGSSDPDDSIALYEWDLDNDGVFGETDIGAARGDETGGSPTFSAAGLDGPISLTVSLRVTDGGGLTDEDTATITVDNVTPTVDAIEVPIDPVNINDQPVSVVVEFSDPGTADTHGVTWDWGDDSTPTVTEIADRSRSAQASHIYATAGVYKVQVTVEDDDGGSDTETYEYIVVYDPDGGFVTGGGWIDSPEGAAPDESLTGKAMFGFVAKYKKGAQAPTGETEFQFRVADLNFHSQSYQWLVVADSKAQYKGEGTINGAGTYGFMLTAVDAKLTPSTDVDLFRIKIWDKATGETIYDNQLDAPDNDKPTTAIGGGNIVVHKR